MDFTFFIKGEGLGQNRTFEGSTDVVNECTKSSSRMFIQYMCQQNEEQLAAKIEIRDKNIMIEIITIVIVSIFIFLAQKSVKAIAV